MAHSLGSTILARSSAATSPITRSATTAAGDTVLVLMLKTVGASDRAGGAPTFNGVAGVQANSTQKAAASPEAGAELWYWVGGITSGAGALFIGTANIVIPNTGTLTIFSAAYTGQAAAGFTSLFDGANGGNGTSANPTAGSITSTVNGAIYFATTAGGWQTFAPSARSGTSLFETDDGADGGGGQYLLQSTLGAQAMSWTFATSDDWGAVAAAFKEAPKPSPGTGTLTLAGALPVLAFAMGIGAASLGLTGQAPTVSIGNPNSPTISVPAGALLFKGPARPQAVAAPSVATLSLAGQTPNLAFTIPINVGALTATGQAPSGLQNDPTPIAQGALSLAGQSPTALQDDPTPIGAGSLSLVGQSVSLADTRPIGAAVLNFTGQAPTLSTGANITIPIGAGSLRFKGPAQLQVDHTIAIAQGALTLTGQAPSIPGNNISIAIGAGALTLSGQTTTRQVDQPIPIPVGTLTLAGQFVGQAFGGLTPAALVFTGYAPTLVITGQTTIAIGAGSLTLTGRTPNLAFVFPVTQGALQLAGQTPLIGAANIPISQASLVLTGRVPSLAFVSPISAGSLSLVGTTSTLASTMPVGAGSLSLTGQAPSLGGTVTISPAQGALTFTGPAPTLNISSSSAIPTATLALSGQTPALAFVYPVSVGALSLSGQLPTRQVDTPRAIGAGTLTLAGTSSALLTSVGIPAGSLSLSGQALSLGGTVTIAIPQGVLGFTGRTPTLDRAIAIGVRALTLAGQAPSSGQSYLFIPPTGALTLTGTVAETLSLNNVKVLTVRPVNEAIYTLVYIGELYTLRDIPS